MLKLQNNQKRIYLDLDEQDQAWLINILLNCIDKDRTSICEKPPPDKQQKETSSDLILMNDPFQKDFEKLLRSIDEKSIFHLKVFVKKAIYCLSYKQRQVLHHMLWESLSVSEIAKKYGMKRDAIYQLKERALKQIARFLLRAAFSDQR